MEPSDQALKAAPIIYQSPISNKPNEGTDPFAIPNYDPFHNFSRGEDNRKIKMEKLIKEGRIKDEEETDKERWKREDKEHFKNLRIAREKWLEDRKIEEEMNKPKFGDPMIKYSGDYRLGF